jgi:hypothetical protein
MGNWIYEELAFIPVKEWTCLSLESIFSKEKRQSTALRQA